MDDSHLKRKCHVCGKPMTCDCYFADYGIVKLNGLGQTEIEFDACPECLGKVVDGVKKTLKSVDIYKDKLYIIGSVSQSDKIQSIADYYIGTGRYEVRYVKPEPEESLLTLIEKCFKNILWSDKVYVVPKPDGTFGDGVSYEVAFAKMMGKVVETFNN